MRAALVAATIVATLQLAACGGQPAQRGPSSAPLTVDSIMRDYRSQQQQGQLNTPSLDLSKWAALKEGMSPRDVAELLGEPGGMRFLNGKTGLVSETGMIMTTIRSPLARSWIRPEGTNEAIWIYPYDGGRSLRFVIFDEIVSDKDSNGKLVDWTERRPAGQVLEPGATLSTQHPLSNPAVGGAEDADRVDWAWPSAGRVVDKFDLNSRGLGIAGRTGDPVYAAADGKVVYSGSGLRGYGQMVIVKHNGAYVSAYAHNSRLLVKEGDSVTRGQKIAEMGSTDTHRTKLHFEIRKSGQAVDPLSYLPPEGNRPSAQAPEVEAAAPPPVSPPPRCAASYTINVTVVLSSAVTQGQSRMMVELRQGTPGASRVIDTKYFEGQTGTIGFSQMCAGSYFIAIGNGDSVAVGPVRQFTDSQAVRTTVRVTPSSGNMGTRSRRGL